MRFIILFGSPFFLLSLFVGCKESKMENEIPSWDREYYEKSEQKPYVFFGIYGSFPEKHSVTSTFYRCKGVPKGITLQKYSMEQHPDTIHTFLEGYLWEKLKESDPNWAIQIESSPELIILSGEPEEVENLNYLRDSVGFITYLLDNGGVCVYDLQMARWWSVDKWKSDIFEHGKPMPWNHVLILLSDIDNHSWLHTRGMRKFGRPDLSVHNITPGQEDAYIEMIERLIALQAYGAVVKEGQEVHMDNIPNGTKCFLRGDIDDYDFNNYHIEIEMPE